MNTSADPSRPATTPPAGNDRRSYQFSTRFLLVIMAVISVSVAVVVESHSRLQRRATLVARYQADGASVTLANWSDDVIELSTWSPRQLGVERIIELAPSLRKLGILQNCDDALLKQLPQLNHLEDLQIREHTNQNRHTNITDDGLAHIAELKSLTSLRLFGCRTITDAGMAHLAKMENLEVLEVSLSSIGDQGVAHLAKLPRLKRLVMSQTLMTDRSLTYLQSTPTLEVLWVGPAVTDDAIKRLSDEASVFIVRWPGYSALESFDDPSRVGGSQDNPAKRPSAKGDRGSRQSCQVAR